MIKIMYSFIVPVYNARNTIVRCLDSIYKLPLNKCKFEVIVIDDCSTDNTVEVIEEYAKKHASIMLLRQNENHRQGAARNRGVSCASGKYIVFVDSDDESVDGVVGALHLAEKHDLDMVAMHYVTVDEYGNIAEKDSIVLDGIFTGVELQTKHPYWGTAPWSYVYKKSFLQKVDYPFREDVFYEDSDFVSVHLFHARSMMYSLYSGYKAYYNAQSTTHTITYKHMVDYMLLGTRMLNFYRSLESKKTSYSLSILEGGCYNIWYSCRGLIKLSSIKERFAFYNRLDAFINRHSLMNDIIDSSYCTFWVRICIQYKYYTIALVSIVHMIYKIYCWFKSFFK